MDLHSGSMDRLWLGHWVVIANPSIDRSFGNWLVRWRNLFRLTTTNELCFTNTYCICIALHSSIPKPIRPESTPYLAARRTAPLGHDSGSTFGRWIVIPNSAIDRSFDTWLVRASKSLLQTATLIANQSLSVLAALHMYIYRGTYNCRELMGEMK